MTPKEKSKELVDKFYQTTPNEAWYNPPIGSITSDKYSAWEQAKECALIAVDEILTSKQTAYPNQIIELGQVFYSYWIEVKTEIGKL